MKLAGDFLVSVAAEKDTADAFATEPGKNLHNWILVKNSGRPANLVAENDSDNEVSGASESPAVRRP
jgi:hypothetical protein